ncbi:very short patch repair endonuclease [Bacillus sp. ISL-41]|uniref:very short patch repair endonuclease n=1 Tax=Bacillus sp. ISL-41 TaxID=2819127 RepID=UPI001BEB7DCB|nr:very short patch repair endonuclease [Bacillus sp. ISL-41]MBT2641917.1 very short patch repair endonuclease [Bacillus sp. ISL-41]
MSDVMNKEQRSNNMKAIKSVSKLEQRVTKALWNKGFRFRKNSKLFGRPDISISKYKIVIFIDSCFWHVCPQHSNMPKNNEEFWRKKLTRNMARDEEVNEYYLKRDWNVLRIWEHEIKKDFEGTIDKIEQFIINSKKHYT